MSLVFPGISAPHFQNLVNSVYVIDDFVMDVCGFFFGFQCPPIPFLHDFIFSGLFAISVLQFV